MGCAHLSGQSPVKNRPAESVDLMSKKKQILINYALSNKIQCIIDIVNSKLPF